MKEDLIALWTAFVESWIRFWNNRFHRGSDELHWLRNQIEAERIERSKLIEQLTAPKGLSEVAIEEPQEKLQVGGKTFVPWHIKQRQLEAASRSKAAQLRGEAKSRSTEELEKELGIEHVD